jgi:hypothetical protein
MLTRSPMAPGRLQPVALRALAQVGVTQQPSVLPRLLAATAAAAAATSNRDPAAQLAAALVVR